MNHDIAISILGQSPSRPNGAESPTGTPHPLTRLSPRRNVQSLYLHVPFCFHKCHYCDFYSIVDSRDRQAAFTARLIAELRALAPFAAPLRTIFVGGGTPTLLRHPHWVELLDAIHECFDLSQILAGQGEFTVECNPETADADLFALLRARGVDRLSMGAQSFQPHLLKALERWHDPRSVASAIELARQAGIDRLSVDLIAAIPGQTLEEFADDLDRALDLGVRHLSCYTLTYEANTAMTRRLRAGEFEAADEDLEIAMQDLALEKLACHGLERYEVSNFGEVGQESMHNLAYWRQEDWLAGGPSASGHVRGWRWRNIPRLGDYLGPDNLGHAGDFPSAMDVEEPDAARALGERLMSGLRLREGVAWPDIAARASAIEIARGIGVADSGSAGTLESLVRVRDRLIEQGYLKFTGDRLVPTASGFRFADLVARDFLGVLIDVGGG